MTIDNKSKYISRKFYRRLMTEIGNNQYDPTKYIKDKIIISVDCLSTKKIVKANEVKVRKLEDIVSQQFLLGYNGKVMYYLLTREQTDSPFDFWDLAMVIKDFLQQIGYEKHYTAIDYEKLATKFSMKVDEVRKYSGKLKIPKLIMVGYLLGDTISSYKNWQSYIDTSKLENQDKDKYVSMYQNALTSYNFVPFSIASPDYKRRAFLEIKLRDNIALTSAQDDLETLAKMFDITITRNNCDEKFSSLAEYIWKNHQKFSDSVLTNYMYLGFISKQVEDIYNAGLTDRFILPARLSELGDRISDHFFQMPYNSKQVKKVIDDIFLNDNVENYLRPQEYKYSLKKGELRKWKKLISKISGQSDEHLRLQDTMLQNIESYLARGAISYKVASDGKPYRKFNKNNIFNKIDLDSLYRNNPELEPSDLITSDISLNPKKYVIDIPNTLRRNYRKNKQKFKRDYYSNEPERIETLIEGLWKSSAYNMAYKKIGGKIKLFSTSTNYYFKQKIDFKYTRNGFHFMKTSNKYNKAQKNMHTIRVNQATNSGFEVARLAFKGGINQAYDHGLISEYKYLYSPDLKSSYPMAGSFIPDFRTDITPLKDESDVSLKEFNKKIRPKLPNGDFTLGICICSYETSDNLKRVPVGVKSNFEDSSPYYVKSADNVEMTLTDAINLINTGVKSMYFNRIIIPHQKILDGSEESLCPVSRAQHWGLKQREMAIEKYGTESPEEKIFKLFVNLQFGKSGQGLLPKDTIPGSDLVRKSTDADNYDPKGPKNPDDRVPVKDPEHLTKGDKDNVKGEVGTVNPNLPKGTEVDVDDKGNATIKYPDGSKNTIPGSDLVRKSTDADQSTDADKITPNVPATKVPVTNPSQLTDSEKDQVKTNVTNANKDTLPSGSKVTVGDDGTATITYSDGSKDTIPGRDLIIGAKGEGISGNTAKSGSKNNSLKTLPQTGNGANEKASALGFLFAGLASIFSLAGRRKKKY